jgi:hypothetical protein
MSPNVQAIPTCCREQRLEGASSRFASCTDTCSESFSPAALSLPTPAMSSARRGADRASTAMSFASIPARVRRDRLPVLRRSDRPYGGPATAVGDAPSRAIDALGIAFLAQQPGTVRERPTHRPSRRSTRRPCRQVGLAPARCRRPRRGRWRRTKRRMVQPLRGLRREPDGSAGAPGACTEHHRSPSRAACALR